MFKELGELEFMAVIIDRGGGHHPHMFHGMEKELIGSLIRERARKLDAEAIVIISEAWTVPKPHEDMNEEELRKYALRYGTVAMHPWKKECLVIDFEFRGGLKEGYNWIIENDGDRRFLVEEGPYWANGSRVVEVSGHLQDFFATLH